MNNNDAPNFFDRRTLTAIFLVFVTWMGWQYYMQTKYPHLFQKKTQTSPPPTATEAPAKPAPAMSEAGNAAKSEAKSDLIQAPEKVFDFQSDNLSFQISSVGMGLKNVKLLKYTSRSGEIEEFSKGDMPHALDTRFMGTNRPIAFEVQKVSDHVWSGLAKVDGLTVTKTIEMDHEKYKFDVKISVVGQDPKFLGLITDLSDELEPPKSGGFLTRSSLERQEAFVDTTESHNNHIYYSGDAVDKSWNNGHVVALGSNYFTQAILDRSLVPPEVKLRMDPTSRRASLQLEHPVLNRSVDFNVHYIGMIGPKSIDLLKSVDEDFVPIVDFGFFNFIARYTLVVLKVFYSMVGNWAVAIILLTVLVRLIVLPFNIISYRSMKTMQMLQPQMQSIKERFKDDQQRANQEVMNLFRVHKVNPAGGCLPIFVQLPFFWALYQVLEHSVELYKQPFPFNLWIHDLSLKDPYYILPVLMGVTMFLQQQITPNPSMDPNQAKLMKFMPILFAFFMISLPSALTLYILVSSLFAVIQQTYFMKSHNPLVQKLEGVR